MLIQSNKKGQLKQLADGLNSKDFQQKKTALKKVIAQMTLGKDLSALFQSVIKCLEHQDLMIKKLVYLYIISYSRTKPDDAIMSINLFKKDATNKGNAVIRALAVRTMSSLRVPKLNEYLFDTLKVALNDDDPYVRKTAVLSVPKLYQIAPNDQDTNALVTILEKLVVKETNALVLANAIASCEQLRLLSGRSHVKVDSSLLGRLLLAVSETIEWAQVFILDFLCQYEPKNEKQAETVLPRLAHINPTVVFSTIRLMIIYLDYLSNETLISNLVKKLAPSIVSIVSFTSVEVQYIILKNIQYIIQKRPSILENQIKCFFCKFTDPYYIKNQKIQILVRIINYKNYQTVLEELREYIQDVDSEFVKKCIKAVGKIAIRYEKSVDKCMSIISKTIKQTRNAASHAEIIVNQLLISTQNILRKYPTKYNWDGMFMSLVYLFDYATYPQAKEAAIWILGQYAEEIPSVSLNTFKKWTASFTSQDRLVQLQILSSAVKTLISDLLTIATENVSNPDVRDRAFIYWRLLSIDPTRTKSVVFGYRPQAKDDDKLINKVFLNQICKSLGYSNSLFEKVPDELFSKSVADRKGIKIEAQEDENQYIPKPNESQMEKEPKAPGQAPKKVGENLIQLL